MAQITLTLDEGDKAEVTTIVEGLGLDLSSVTRAFYKQIIRQRRVPLDLALGSDELPEAPAPSLHEVDPLSGIGERPSYLSSDPLSGIGERPSYLSSDPLTGTPTTQSCLGSDHLTGTPGTPYPSSDHLSGTPTTQSYRSPDEMVADILHTLRHGDSKWSGV